MSEQKHKNVYVALAAAQAEMGKVGKGSVNPAFKSRYADLADVVSAVQPPLNAHGMAFFHQIVITDGNNIMRTVLMHGESETSIQCDVPLIVSKNDMQGMKSATTYAKRIGLESVTGVAPEDDDGNAAAANPPKAAPKQEAKPAPLDPVAKADAMIGALRSKGLHMKDHPKFAGDLELVRASNPEQAARVEAEIETLDRNADLDGDRIQY